jgi:peroxiredoxin family protein
MPKAKPTHVIVHRIELQEKERELLEPFVKAKEVEQFAKAGSMVVTAAALGATAYATWWTLETIHGWGEKAKDRMEEIADRITTPANEMEEEKGVPWWYKLRINYLFGNHL